MPNKNPSQPNRFKKGQSGNPKGREPLPPEVVVIRQFTQAQVAEVGAAIFQGDVKKLEAMEDDPTITAFQLAVVRCIRRVISKGDVNGLNTLLDRFVGKVPTALLVKKVEGGGDFDPSPAKPEPKTITIEVVDASES